MEDEGWKMEGGRRRGGGGEDDGIKDLSELSSFLFCVKYCTVLYRIVPYCICTNVQYSTGYEERG